MKAGTAISGRCDGQGAAMFAVGGEAKRPQWEKATKKKHRRR